jgi:hypothetical protein
MDLRGTKRVIEGLITQQLQKNMEQDGYITTENWYSLILGFT